MIRHLWLASFELTLTTGRGRHETLLSITHTCTIGVPEDARPLVGEVRPATAAHLVPPPGGVPTSGSSSD